MNDPGDRIGVVPSADRIASLKPGVPPCQPTIAGVYSLHPGGAQKRKHTAVVGPKWTGGLAHWRTACGRNHSLRLVDLPPKPRLIKAAPGFVIHSVQSHMHSVPHERTQIG